MDTITYKCPHCDAGLVFDPESQKFKCEYCLSEFTEEELKKIQEEPAGDRLDKAGNETPENSDAEDQEETEAADSSMVLYTCPNCGAEIIAEETTVSTLCYYCHNPVVLSGKLEGNYQPDYVIPFEMDRKKAEEIFKEWIRRKRYVPGDFYSPKQIELMEGIYYPYWLYSCKVDGKVHAEGIKRQVTRTGSIEYTETSRYQVEREGKMEVKNVSRNALRKADRRLSEEVLPYDMDKIKPFQAAYLSGFQAERRDREKEEFERDVETEIHQFAVESLKNSISGYDSVNIKDHEEQIEAVQWNYAFLPVWVMTYKDRKNDKLYYFAMNGQSGKICGVLPVDYGKLAGLFAMIFVPMLLLMLIGGYLL